MKALLSIIALSILLCAIAWAQAPQQPAQTPPSPRAGGATSAGFDGSAYTKARDIPARIVSFTAEPATIKPGQSFLLVGHTENPAGVTIDPEPGRVTPRGTRQLKPSATTTYTLTVRGAGDRGLTQAVTESGRATV